MSALTFFVPGIPAPGGSKRFVGFGKVTKRAILVDMGGEKTKNWRSSVAHCALEAMGRDGVSPFTTGPLRVCFAFVMPRPKGHFNAKGLLREACARLLPTTRPDALKLSRSTEDALTGVVWNDDAQTVQLQISKRYATALGESSGCYITIEGIEL